MRIRKHLQLAAGDSPRLPSRICLLNQSPWDVLDSSSSPLQGIGDDCFGANGGCFGNSIGATDSVTDMETFYDSDPIDLSLEQEEHEEEEEEEEEEERGLCAKSDGKSWFFKSEAARGNLLCEHHLEQLRNYQSLAQPSVSMKKKKKKYKKKETEKIEAVTRASSRRVRAKKTAKSSNPYEFYYYSGFGPSWGKKRGAQKTPADHELVVAEKAEISQVLHSYSSSGICEIDTIDSADDDEEESGGMRKGRGRKRIKARSLKSLM